MAALDFPNAPTTGQYFVAGNGVTYQWNGTMWLPVGGSSALYIGDTPPSNPGPGQLWFNATLATLYVYYNDGNSTQWVPANPVPAPAVAPTIVPTGLVQAKIFRTGAMATGTTAFSGSDAVPIISQGTEVMTLAFTPLVATNRLIVDVITHLSFNAGPGQLITALFQDAITNALACEDTNYPANQFIIAQTFSWDAIAGSTTARTFRVRCGGNQAGTMTFNGTNGLRQGGGTMMSSIKIMEVLP